MKIKPPKGWRIVTSGRVRKGDRLWCADIDARDGHPGRWEKAPLGVLLGHRVIFCWKVARRIQP